MAASQSPARQKFFVEIIKPSHYDDDGYVIQWWRAFIPSNSLACLSALAEDARSRKILGDDIDIVVNAYDECLMFVPTQKIIKRLQQRGGRGVVLLAGVQSNQFPRAADLAGEFRAAGIQVVIGGFHVSGCISMLPELPPEIKAVQEIGVSLFAGEAESKLDQVLIDACRGTLQPVYNHLLDLPDLQGQVTPLLPPGILRGSFNFAAFDVGRGCPFRCSFCTIINVQGRKSRFRDADDVERIVRANSTRGVDRFFITDDNMARNKNWESIFDRLIHLREQEGFQFKLLVQVDTMCHKIPNFIEKAARAGCNRVFIGMESVSPENLVAAKKFQNKISEYRAMLQAWRAVGTMTHAGYILGFPADTPESIERDIRLIQKELPIDILEFFILTPLPGSADHKELYLQGVPMDPDMNSYDTEHVTTAHRKMSSDQWRDIYHRAWHLYYTPEHIETILRRAVASGTGVQRMVGAIMMYYGSVRFEHLHPLQSGLLRRKVRTTRRSAFPRENPFVFHARRAWETVSTSAAAVLYYLELQRIRRRVVSGANAKHYSDEALAPVNPADLEAPETCTAHSPPAIIPISVPSAAPGEHERHEHKRAA
jgi:radical SAM superfamily enzyme YgiQ (UPF0313 family)